ncbi:HNH endonuclease [Rhizobium bangladeshense]|uniref:HNH endonuclease n=1 Tax=Rhizobium bangladeshense TaxID=1138189 RepID=UPI0007E5AF3D|nr:HNH endonuclease [Rhizobium bangladeshense]
MIRIRVPAYDWALVQHLSRRDDDAKPTLWERTTGRVGRFKRDVTALLMVQQRRRCAYCRSYLHEDYPARDHVAPKAVYPKWTFRPENLVLACYACNTDRKDSYDPIEVWHRKYRRCRFKIVHPYFDRPGAHLDYSIGGPRQILIAGITPKGDETISRFELMTPERAKERAADALVEDQPNRLQQQFQNDYRAVLAMRRPLKPAVRIRPARL